MRDQEGDRRIMMATGKEGSEMVNSGTGKEGGGKLNQTKSLSQSIGVSYVNPFTPMSSIKGQIFTKIQSNHIFFYYSIQC